MTPEQINQRIAEACGPTKGHWEEFASTACQTVNTGRIWIDHGWTGPGGKVYDELPNYHGDLNAMHEAECALQNMGKFWPDYIDELSKLFRCGFSDKDATNWSQMCRATAPQRAEAFLRTLGIWEEK
jgi:hypothetical protein